MENQMGRSVRSPQGYIRAKPLLWASLLYTQDGDILVLLSAIMYEALQHTQGRFVTDVIGFPALRQCEVVYKAESLTVLSPKQGCLPWQQTRSQETIRQDWAGVQLKRCMCRVVTGQSVTWAFMSKVLLHAKITAPVRDKTHCQQYSWRFTFQEITCYQPFQYKFEHHWQAKLVGPNSKKQNRRQAFKQHSALLTG